VRAWSRACRAQKPQELRTLRLHGKALNKKKALRKFKQKATRKKGFKQEKKPLNKTPFFF